ncbi:phage SPO1 DNA polymerase-related protein [Ferriphaselus amnicola]|uniref:Type-4 uracil-DNA glycosylase n=1 Tax=Ferriphaselus amnicola TaxID=1188319 RepID=A0A2Z6GF07_9PROT|nr:uracil-DNA glycosylase [Ferriphaselus amnicola]BBE52201.1 phage SPO1 DNA polymerase-related protein [Ferriphaselus amnicola]
MSHDNALLRELNLYPLWVRRDAEAVTSSVAVAPQQPTPPESEMKRLTAPVSTANQPSPYANLGWEELKEKVKDCTDCKLRPTCTQTVFGVGDEQADWMIVGEGPGADEDIKGEPFVGQAGKLLDNMLAAIKLKRSNNVYIGNIVKCRPPANRTPEADEVTQCLPYLRRQIELIQPKLIVALGKTAATSLLGRDAALGSLRGQLHEFNGVPLIITYHPAYLLRSPTEKAKAWQDLCLAVATMEKLIQP